MTEDDGRIGTRAAQITLPHFSVSSAISLPKSAGECASTRHPGRQAAPSSWDHVNYSTFCASRLSRSAGIIENQQIWFTSHRYLNDPSELRFGIDAAAVTREAEEEMGQMTRFAGLETTGLKLGDVASCDTFQSARF